MRIISGSFKGRRLNPPNNLPVRPVTDMAKEALFNIFNNILDYEGISAIDLFAGVGNISFELVSRGCPSVTSVDINPKCIDFIKKTAADLKMTEIHTVRADVFDFITRLNTQYDLIFADPPYDNPNLADLPELVLGNNLLAEDGLFVLEHPNKYDFTKRPRCIDHRVYSRVNFSFFK